MRINGTRLDPADSYTSIWLGDRTGGGEASVIGTGAPVVGVYGSKNETRAGSLALFFLVPPRPDPPVKKVVELPEVKPAPEQKPVVEQKPEPPRQRKLQRSMIDHGVLALRSANR